jgi:peptidoglycan glycosyltransferase
VSHRTLTRRPLNEVLSDAAIERMLLAIAALFVTVNLAALQIIRQAPANALLPLLVWLISALGGHVLLNRWLPRRDPLLFPICMFLSGWGISAIDRLAPSFADRQAIWLLISTLAMLATACFPYVLRTLRDFRYLLLIGGIGLLLASILFGVNPSGAEGAPALWLGFGGIYFQPSEVLKILLVAFLASYLAEQYPLLSARDLQLSLGDRTLSPRLIGPVLLMWGICIVILIWQQDLGTALVFFIVFLAMLYLASGQGLLLVAGAGLIGVAGIIAYESFGVVTRRVDIWLNPWLEAEGRAYHIVQSLLAFANGGIFGQGIGQGAPGYVPVVHSDSIFAALGEEWGLLGTTVLLGVLLLLIGRGLQLSIQHQERPFYALLAVGLITLIAVQSLLIMGGVIKLIPLTGVTLPFVSYGGSSLLVSFIMLGLLLRLSSSEDSHAL